MSSHFFTYMSTVASADSNVQSIPFTKTLKLYCAQITKSTTFLTESYILWWQFDTCYRGITGQHILSDVLAPRSHQCDL